MTIVEVFETCGSDQTREDEPNPSMTWCFTRGSTLTIAAVRASGAELAATPNVAVVTKAIDTAALQPIIRRSDPGKDLELRLAIGRHCSDPPG